MSGDNVQFPPKASGVLPDGGGALPDEDGSRRGGWGGTMWLAMVGEIARTVDDDYASRPYPVLEEVVQEEGDTVPSQGVSESVLPVPEVGAQGKEGIKPPLSPWGPLIVGKPPRRRRRRSRSGRGASAESGRRWRASMWLSLVVVVGGVWLIMREAPGRKDWTKEEFGDVRVPDAVMPRSVVEEVHLQAQKIVVETPPVVRPVDINSLALAQVDNHWEMAEGEWTAEPRLVADASAASAAGGGPAGPVVTPVEDGSRPAPSAAFLSYAATLKITSVAWGKRVRATINGANYIEEAVLEPELGVRLVGRDAQERALIFESSETARVKVSY